MNISEQEKNRIKELHRKYSIISEQETIGAEVLDIKKVTVEMMGHDLEQLMNDIGNHNLDSDRITDRIGVILNKLHDDHYFRGM